MTQTEIVTAIRNEYFEQRECKLQMPDSEIIKIYNDFISENPECDIADCVFFDCFD